MVYGFRDCVKCGARVNENKDKRCMNCGAEVTPAIPKHAGGRPVQVPWSAAYLKTCPKCEAKYTPKERTCPQCAPSPENYLARAHFLQQSGGGRHTSGKLAGRTGRAILLAW